MLKLWNALEKKFHVGGNVNQTTRFVLLVAKLFFWWLYVGKPLNNHLLQQKRFVAFFELEDEMVRLGGMKK